MTDAALERLMLILNTALPYLFPPMDGFVELMVKLLDTICSFRGFRQHEHGEKRGGQGENDKNVDFEGLLNAVSLLCSEQERAMIERIGGMFRALSFYKMYQGVFSQEDGEQGTLELLKKMTGNEGLNLDMLKALSSVMADGSFMQGMMGGEANKESTGREEGFAGNNTPEGEAPEQSGGMSDSTYDELIQELEGRLSPEERELYREFKSIFN